MPILTKSQEARFMDFCDKMRNPEAMDQVTYHEIVYPFNMNMCIQMVRDNNPFFNIYPSYSFGEDTICAYLAFAACTDSEFDLCIMANTDKDYNRILNKVYYFVKKSRFSLITKLLACSRLAKKFYIGNARYVYIAQYERTFDPDDNCFVGWVHPRVTGGTIDENRPHAYGTHVIKSRMHDMRTHTIISGKDAYDVLKTQIGSYLMYYNVIDADLDSCKEDTHKTAGEYFKNREKNNE